MEFEMVITVKNRTISDLLDEPFAAIDLVFVAATGKLDNILRQVAEKCDPITH